MGTRSTTHIYDEKDKHILALYRQFDGYVEGGHGEELQNLLKDRKIVNGYTLGDNEANKVSNGMSCLAATLVAHFKKDIGVIYIANEDDKEEYNYHVRYKDGKVQLEVEYDGNTRELELYNETSQFVN